jgi:hypothetical protein
MQCSSGIVSVEVVSGAGVSTTVPARASTGGVLVPQGSALVLSVGSDDVLVFDRVRLVGAVAGVYVLTTSETEKLRKGTFAVSSLTSSLVSDDALGVVLCRALISALPQSADGLVTNQMYAQRFGTRMRDCVTDRRAASHCTATRATSVRCRRW